MANKMPCLNSEVLLWVKSGHSEAKALVGLIYKDAYKNLHESLQKKREQSHFRLGFSCICTAHWYNFQNASLVYPQV